MTSWYYNYDKETKQLLNELFGSLSVGVVADQNVFTSENGDAFVVTMALPGINRDDIKITAKDNALSVNYQPKEPTRFVKSFKRSWDSKGLNVDALTATYADGILTVTVPKAKKAEPAVKTFVVAQLDKITEGAYTANHGGIRLFTMNQKHKPKYNVGDLVCRGEAIVLKVHEKADYNQPFYLVHFIQTDQETWVGERRIDLSWQQQYTMLTDLLRLKEAVDESALKDILNSVRPDFGEV